MRLTSIGNIQIPAVYVKDALEVEMQLSTEIKELSAQQSSDIIGTDSLAGSRGRGHVISLEELEKRMILSLRERAFTVLVRVYCASLLPTFVIIFLQGFHIKGFDLPQEFLYWLAAITLGKLGGFTYLMLRFIFNQSNRSGSSKKRP